MLHDARGDPKKISFVPRDGYDAFIATQLGLTMKACLGITGLSDFLALILGWETCLGASVRLMPIQQTLSLGVFAQLLAIQVRPVH